MADEKPFDASDAAQVKERVKDSKRRESSQDEWLKQAMTNPVARTWFYDVLSFCHVFQTSFATNALMMANREGERNVGLKLTADLMRATPELYLTMLNEESING